jgi:hypothetical protein
MRVVQWAAEWALAAAAMLLIAAFLVSGFYFFTIRPYMNCFSRPIPSWSHVGHFERCILGVRPGFFDNKDVWHDESDADEAKSQPGK